MKYYSFEVSKDVVYHRKPTTMCCQEANVTQAVHHTHKCLEANGRHFEHLLQLWRPKVTYINLVMSENNLVLRYLCVYMVYLLTMYILYIYIYTLISHLWLLLTSKDPFKL